MRVVGMYSFNDGEAYIKQHYPQLLQDVKDAIQSVDSQESRTKVSDEKTMPGKILYSPRDLNVAFKQAFEQRGWQTGIRIQCDYPVEYYVDDYQPSQTIHGAFREIDFVKDRLGVEVQFGKYAFMVYNVCAKMTIFNKNDIIKAGIEIVPVREFARQMSTGVSYFEQFVWDLEQRGVADIDIPVLILGITHQIQE